MLSYLQSQRRLVLRRHSRGHRRRLSPEHGRRVVEPGLEGAGAPTTPSGRCAPSPAGAAGPEQARACAGAAMRALADGRAGAALGAFRSRRAAPAAAEGRWSLVAARGTRPQRPSRHRARGRAGPAAAGPLRPGHPRGGRGRGDPRRLQRGLRGAAHDGGDRARSGAATSWAGWRRCSSRCPRCWRCCAACAQRPETPEVVTLLAVDPANPYGALLPWPGARRRGRAPGNGAAGRRRRRRGGARRGATRAVGTHVILVDGALAAWVGRGGRQLLTLPARRRARPQPGGRGAGARPLARLAGGERAARPRCCWPRSTTSPPPSTRWPRP